MKQFKKHKALASIFGVFVILSGVSGTIFWKYTDPFALFAQASGDLDLPRPVRFEGNSYFGAQNSEESQTYVNLFFNPEDRNAIHMLREEVGALGGISAETTPIRMNGKRLEGMINSRLKEMAPELIRQYDYDMSGLKHNEVVMTASSAALLGVQQGDNIWVEELNQQVIIKAVIQSKHQVGTEFTELYEKHFLNVPFVFYSESLEAQRYVDMQVSENGLYITTLYFDDRAKATHYIEQFQKKIAEKNN